MKTHIASLVILLAALAGPAAGSTTAAPDSNPCVLYRVNCVKPRLGHNPLTVGATAQRVESVLGQPHHQPSRDVWIYHYFHADRNEANPQGCTNLVITFDRVGHRVADLKLVNDPAVAVIIAQAEATPTAIPRVLAPTK